MDLSKFSDATLQQMASGQPLDFSKLSDDELKEIAGPSEPPAASKAASEPSTLSDALTGAGDALGVSQQVAGASQAVPNAIQSALHNISPSLVGASPTQVNTALAKMGIKGDIGPQSSAELYKQGTKDELQRQNQALERSPIAYRAGELGGLVTGGMATAGLAPELMGARGTAALGKVISNPLAKAAAGAINAAPVGALYGALNSQGSLIGGTPEEQQQVAESAKGGAELGGALGAVAPAIGAGIDKLAKSDATKRLSGLYQMGKEGINLGSDEAQLGTLANPESIQNALSTFDERSAKEILDGLNKMDDNVIQGVSSSLKDATEKGVNIQGSPTLNKQLDHLMGNIPDIAIGEEGLETNPSDEYSESLFKNLSDYANKFKEQGLSPNEMWNFRAELGDIGKNLKNSADVQDRMMAADVFKTADALGNLLKQNVPEYGTQASRMSEFRRLMPETILSKDNPVDVTGLRMSGTRNVDTKLLNNLKRMISGIFTGDDVAQGSFTNLLKGMQELNQNELERKAAGQIKSTLFDDLGMQPDQIEQHLRDTAYRSKLAQSYVSPSDLSVGKLLEKPVKNWLSDAAANKAGLIARDVQEGAAKNPIINIGKKLYAATDDTLQNFSSNVLSKIPGQKQLADALDRAIAHKDQVAKNAVLFSIMQNPNLRNLVESNNMDLEPQ